MKRPKRLMDLVGMTVRTKREMRNGFMTMPAGTMLTVCDNSIGWKKLALEGTPCPHCGVRPHINRVSIDDVEIVTVIDRLCLVCGGADQHKPGCPVETEIDSSA